MASVSKASSFELSYQRYQGCRIHGVTHVFLAQALHNRNDQFNLSQLFGVRVRFEEVKFTHIKGKTLWGVD